MTLGGNMGPDITMTSGGSIGFQIRLSLKTFKSTVLSHRSVQTALLLFLFHLSTTYLFIKMAPSLGGGWDSGCLMAACPLPFLIDSGAA